MRPTWEVAVVEMESQTLMSGLARRLGGAPDTVSSLPAVRLPDDSFVVQFSNGLFGAMSPGNRQQVSRWIDHVNRGVSPYLQEGINYVESGAEVMMILDLQDAFAAGDVERGIEDFETVKSSQVDRAELAELVASVKGVMLGITFRDRAYAKLKIDFSQDASLLSSMGKPLVLEILGAYGVMIDEFADWKAEVKGNRMFLGGALSYHGLTRLASLIELPTAALQANVADSQDQPTPANTAGQGDNPTPLATTQKYFESVEHLLKNLRARKRDIKTMGQVAQWFENYGRKVDRLPTLNVDEEMLQYGSYISSQLHGAAMSLKGTTIQRRVDEVGASNSASIYGGAIGNVSQSNWQGGGYGGNYGRRMETNAAYGIARRGGAMGAFKSQLRQQQQAKTAVRTQAKAQAATSIQQIIQNIQTAGTQIRRSMTQKYQVQF